MEYAIQSENVNKKLFFFCRQNNYIVMIKLTKKANIVKIWKYKLYCMLEGISNQDKGHRTQNKESLNQQNNWMMAENARPWGLRSASDLK